MESGDELMYGWGSICIIKTAISLCLVIYSLLNLSLALFAKGACGLNKRLREEKGKYAVLRIWFYC